MTLEPTLQRRIMGQFATGVTLITTRFGDGEGDIWAMTANSFTSLSLDPPLIIVNIDRRNAMRDYILQGENFAVNFLTCEQENISRQFAMRGPKDFSNVDFTAAKSGAPILVGALAFVDCRLSQVIEGGDHDILIGHILAGGINPHGGHPLVFYNGRYTRVISSGVGVGHSASPETLEEAYGYYGSM